MNSSFSICTKAKEIIKEIKENFKKLPQFLPLEKANDHYSEHKDKPFFNDLVSFITSSPIIAIALEGPNCVGKIRSLMGKTNPSEALPGTIRGDYGVSLSMNLIHGSDSVESANRELKIFFNARC